MKNTFSPQRVMGEADNAVLELQAKTPFFSAPFKMYGNLRKHKELLKHFIFRDLKVRYHNSFIGYGWSVLEPLALTVTFYILFAIITLESCLKN